MSKLWLTAVAPTPKPTFAVSGWNRCRPLGTCDRRHRGVDFRARIGTDIFSILPGTVVLVKSDAGGDTGKMVIVEHESGLRSRYLHLSKTLVTEGQFVTHGQRLGKSGDTGAPGHPHLHLDLLLPELQIPVWVALFGMPKTGFTEQEGGFVRVPAEPIIPINGGNSHVFKEAAQLNIPLRFELFIRINPVATLFPFLPQIRTPRGLAGSDASTTEKITPILLVAGAITFGAVMGSAVARRPAQGAAIGAATGASAMALMLALKP